MFPVHTSCIMIEDDNAILYVNIIYLNVLTLVTRVSCPPWFTAYVTLSCKPVTFVCYLTVWTAFVTAVMPIVT